MWASRSLVPIPRAASRIALAFAGKIGEVAGGFPGNFGAGDAKPVRIREGPAGLRGIVIAQASRNLRADHIRSLIAISQACDVAAVVDTQRLPGLQSDHSVNRPAAQYAIQHGIHGTADQAILSYRNIENDRSSQSLRRVIGAD